MRSLLLRSTTLLLISFFSLSTAAAAMPQDPAATPRPGGDITTFIVGFEQVGGPSTSSDQKYFMDFFISRPLPGFHADSTSTEDRRVFGPKLRWWGNLRVSSAPQQITTEVAKFATEFVDRVGSLKVNELAKFGEFKSGLEYRVASLPGLLFWNKSVRQRSSLGFVMAYGASSPFHPPTDTVSIFNIPTDTTTPQTAAFNRRYPSDRHPDLKLAGAKYIAFTIPDRNQFFHQYEAGLRLTTQFLDESNTPTSPPSRITAAIGQNELVTGGRPIGTVATIEAFYPYSIKKSAITLYLFGRANWKLGTPATQSTPLALVSAPATVGITDPGVVIISEASRRDLYSIGMGIDFSRILEKWLGPK